MRPHMQIIHRGTTLLNSRGLAVAVVGSARRLQTDANKRLAWSKRNGQRPQQLACSHAEEWRFFTIWLNRPRVCQSFSWLLESQQDGKLFDCGRIEQNWDRGSSSKLLLDFGDESHRKKRISS